MNTIARVLLLIAAAAAGCKVVTTPETYHWTVKAPPSIPLHAHFVFSTEARASDGRAVAEVPFVWEVRWAGVNGVEHQGWSSRLHTIRVKGDPGPATLRILEQGPTGMVEVARHEFRVEAGPAANP